MDGYRPSVGPLPSAPVLPPCPWYVYVSPIHAYCPITSDWLCNSSSCIIVYAWHDLAISSDSVARKLLGINVLSNFSDPNYLINRYRWRSLRDSGSTTRPWIPDNVRSWSPRLNYTLVRRENMAVNWPDGVKVFMLNDAFYIEIVSQTLMSWISWRSGEAYRSVLVNICVLEEAFHKVVPILIAFHKTCSYSA